MKYGYAAFGRRFQWAIGWLALLLALSAQAQAAAAKVPSPVPGDPPTVLVMGDSLSAGYGLGPNQGWVPLTAERIARERPRWRVVNASISGETTAGGASRIIAEVLRLKPAVVVIELGANDGLRGLPLLEMRRNLARMIGVAQYAGAKVLLIGMRIPPNYGADYTQGFERTYRDLAALFHVDLLPFLLEPVAADRANFQDDNLHPIAAAQPALRDHVWKQLQPLLR